MPNEPTIANAQIVTPHEIIHGSVHIRDGVIADLQPNSFCPPGAINAAGDYLIPGLVDVHTDNFEQLVRPRKSVDWPILPALLAHDAQMVSAGITTIFDSLCVGYTGVGTRSFTTLKNTIDQILRCSDMQLLRGNHMLHLRAEVSQEALPEMFASIYPNELIRLVSLMDHTPGQRQWRDLERYVAMEKKDYQLNQEEIDRFLESAMDRHTRLSGPNRLKVLSMMNGDGIALASHDDTTVDHVELAHREGITISEFPTTIDAAQAARERGMHIVAGSPNLVLGRSHSGNVSVDELAQHDLLDGLASDYVPSSLLQAPFLLHQRLQMPIPQAIRKVSLAPAQMVGLTDRGAIEVGMRADLVRVRLVDGHPIVCMVWNKGERVA